MSKTFRPSAARTAARLRASVVFPQPPFWLMIARITEICPSAYTIRRIHRNSFPCKPGTQLRRVNRYTTIRMPMNTVFAESRSYRSPVSRVSVSTEFLEHDNLLCCEVVKLETQKFVHCDARRPELEVDDTPECGNDPAG